MKEKLETSAPPPAQAHYEGLYSTRRKKGLEGVGAILFGKVTLPVSI